MFGFWGETEWGCSTGSAKTLSAGLYDIIVWMEDGNGGDGVRLAWTTPTQSTPDVIPSSVLFYNSNEQLPQPSGYCGPKCSDAKAQGDVWACMQEGYGAPYYQGCSFSCKNPSSGNPLLSFCGEAKTEPGCWDNPFNEFCNWDGSKCTGSCDSLSGQVCGDAVNMRGCDWDCTGTSACQTAPNIDRCYFDDYSSDYGLRCDGWHAP